jgi:two-component sensor histidine kinase/ligand-binding sensor domain-containing protein
MLLFFISLGAVRAQNIIKHFTIEDGLPSNEVHFVHQDNNGYYWFCTDRGISRYNGDEFTNFTVADGLTNNTVFKCFEDWNGDLWFTGIDGSITVYTQHTKEFNAYIHSDFLSEKYSKQEWVQNIGFDQELREVYFFMLQNSEEDWIYIADSQSIKGVSEKDFILTYGKKSDKLLISRAWSHPQKDCFLAVYNPSSENLDLKKIENLIAKNKGLYEIVPSFYAVDGSLFLCNASGVYNLSDSTPKSWIGQVPASGVIKDMEDYFWITTLTDGVFMMADNETFSYSLHDEMESYEKLNLGKAFKGKIILGVNPYSNLVLDPDNLEVQKYSGYRVARFPTFFYNADSSILYFDNVVFRFSDNKVISSKEYLEVLWLTDEVFSIDGVVYQAQDVEPLTGKVISVNANQQALRYGKDIVSWLVKYNKYDGSVIRGNHGALRDYYFGEDYVYIACNFGLMKSYKDERQNEVVDLGDNYKTMGISDLDTMQEVTILATKGHGIIGVKEDKLVFKIEPSENLLSMVVNSIYNDRKHNTLWCGTDKGVSVFNYTYINGSFDFSWVKNIRKIDGLYSNYINDIEKVGSNMIAISDDGITSIPLDYTPSLDCKPPTVLLGYINGDSTYFASGERFTSSQNNLEFHYESVSVRRAKGSYQYRLVRGEDSVAWTLTDDKNIRINNVAPGTYAFQVRARVADSKWGAPSQYSFIIEKKFIDRWWVRGVIVSILCGVAYFIFIVRLRRLQEKNKLLLSNQDLELQVAKLESSSLRGQMNPHFMFNVLNSIQKLILKEEKENANKLLTRFSKLVRASLKYSRLEYISLREEIAFLENYLSIEAQRFPDRFTYQIDVGEELLNDAYILPLLIQPLCENCIKHAFIENGGTIRVRISVKDGELMQIVVEDNGVGVNSTSRLKKSSLGTTIIRDRLKLIEKSGGVASLKIELADKKKRKGTRATLVLPYN